MMYIYIYIYTYIYMMIYIYIHIYTYVLLMRFCLAGLPELLARCQHALLAHSLGGRHQGRAYGPPRAKHITLCLVCICRVHPRTGNPNPPNTRRKSL